MITFCKNKQSGQFDIVGLAIEIASGAKVSVTKADGEKKIVTAGRVSKPFIAKFGANVGKECVIATIVQSSNGSDRATGETKTCWECGCTFTYAQCKASDGDWSDSYCGC